jgi:hypothetical protein
MTAASTTIFVRDEVSTDGAPFVAVEHRGSITLQTLMETHDCSCVVECDEHGRAQARAIVIDNPAEQLHRGAFYLSRSKKQRRERDETATNTSAASAPQVPLKAVHFNTRVAVREFSIPNGRADDEPEHTDNENVGRPSIDLFAVRTIAPLSAAVAATNVDRTTPSQLCFKSFHATDPSDGAPITVTLDVFHQLVQESKLRLEGAADRHQTAMKEIVDAEDFLRKHSAFSQGVE